MLRTSRPKEFRIQRNGLNIIFTAEEDNTIFPYLKITLLSPSTIDGRDFSDLTFNVHRDYTFEPQHALDATNFRTGEIKNGYKLCGILTQNYGATEVAYASEDGLDPTPLNEVSLDGTNSYLIRILKEGHYVLLELKRKTDNKFDAILYNSLVTDQPSYNKFIKNIAQKYLSPKGIHIDGFQAITPRKQSLENLPTNDCLLYMCDFTNRILNGEALTNGSLEAEGRDEEIAKSIDDFKVEKRTELAIEIGLSEAVKTEEERALIMDGHSFRFTQDSEASGMVRQSEKFIKDLAQKLKGPAVEVPTILPVYDTVLTSSHSTSAGTGAGGDGSLGRAGSGSDSITRPAPHPPATPIRTAAVTQTLQERFLPIKYRGREVVGSRVLFTPQKNTSDSRDEDFSMSQRLVEYETSDKISSYANNIIAQSLETAKRNAIEKAAERRLRSVEFEDEEIAAIILIAKKYNGISLIKDNSFLKQCLSTILKRSELKFDENFLRAVRYFSKDFQESNKKLGLETGNEEAIKGNNIVGMRLKRLTNDHISSLFLPSKKNLEIIDKALSKLGAPSTTVRAAVNHHSSLSGSASQSL